MEEYKLVGIFTLKGYPELDLFEELSNRMDKHEFQHFMKEKLKKKIKFAYTLYILHVVAFSLLGVGVFIAGYYTYENLFPLSIVLSVIFAVIFIYLSKSRDIKLEYFRFFKIFFMENFLKCCYAKETLDFTFKKTKILIHLKPDTEAS